MKKTLLLLGLLAPLTFQPQILAQDAPDAPPSPPTVPEAQPTAPSVETPVAPPVATPVAPALDDAARIREATLAYNAGLAALKKNDLDAAAQNFGKSAALSPNDAGALSFLGYVRLQQKRWDEALSALLAAQETGTGLNTRARAQLLNNIGFARWNKDEFPAARAAFESALALDKGYFDARYNLAFALMSRDLFSAALPHLRQLSVQNPKDATIWDGLAEAFEKTGNTASALGAAKRAIALEPRNEAYRLKFALALSQSDRRAEAIAQLRQLLAQSPNNAPALLQLGDLHLRSNRWGDAAAVLKRYVALRNTDFTGRFNLGVAYDYSAKFDDALAQYGEAEKLRPNDAATKNNVGRIYFKRDRLDEAVTKFNQALALDPDFYDARTNLAIVLAAQKKWDEAGAQWQTLATSAETASRATKDPAQKRALTNRLTTAYSGLASIALSQNKWKDAAAHYRRLLAIAPNDLEARSSLGRALFQDKDLAGAEATYRQVIARNPKSASAYNDLGVVLESKKDRKGALEAYSRALQLQPAHSEAKSNIARLRGNAPVG